MSMSTGSSGRIAPDLNVTPFIDILLVLLIIFIVIAASMGSKGEQALIPQPPPPGITPPTPPHTVVIRLLPAANGDDGRPQLFINKEPLTWEGLHDRLFNIYAARVERVAFIQAGKDVTFQYVGEVIDTAHSLDIDKVGLIQPNVAMADE